jgi:GNAT superfamily N-acetyltransferase
VGKLGILTKKLIFLCPKNLNRGIKMIRAYPIDQDQIGCEIYGSPVTLTFLHYDAPSVWTSGRDINCWAYDLESIGPHFEDNKVGRFMQIFDGVDTEMKFRNPPAEVDERKRFAKSPFHLVMIGNSVAGGIWVENVDRSTGHARFHIVVDPAYRGTVVADRLLEYFETDSIELSRYSSVSCAFGPREDCDPARFFRSHGYEVEGSKENGGVAVKLISGPAVEEKQVQVEAPPRKTVLVEA